MAYRQSIINRLDRQTQKGIKKYCDTLDKSGHLKSPVETLEYLAEELTDGLQYFEHAKALVSRLEEENRRLREEQTEYAESVIYWREVANNAKQR